MRFERGQAVTVKGGTRAEFLYYRANGAAVVRIPFGTLEVYASDLAPEAARAEHAPTLQSLNTLTAYYRPVRVGTLAQAIAHDAGQPFAPAIQDAADALATTLDWFVCGELDVPNGPFGPVVTR